MAFGANYNYNPYANPYASPYNGAQGQFQQPMQFNQQVPQMQQQAPQTPQNGFVWVDGIEEANSFYVAPNNAVQLWDKNAPCIYKKSADSTGKPTMQIFDLVERKTDTLIEKSVEKVDYVLRSEFEELKEIVSTLTAKKPKAKVKGVEEDA